MQAIVFTVLLFQSNNSNKLKKFGKHVEHELTQSNLSKM